MIDVVEEVWQEIPEFPNYQISSLGRIHSDARGIIMRPSFTPFGHLKITLASNWDGLRHTRGVAQLVADAFVEPPNLLCDSVMILDGDFSNVAAHNLAWRPQWFVWKYTRQLKKQQPLHFHNLRTRNIVTGVEYENIIQAGMSEGLLFGDIWRSTYTGAALFPNGSIFEIVK